MRRGQLCLALPASAYTLQHLIFHPSSHHSDHLSAPLLFDTFSCTITLHPHSSSSPLTPHPHPSLLILTPRCHPSLSSSSSITPHPHSLTPHLSPSLLILTPHLHSSAEVNRIRVNSPRSGRNMPVALSEDKLRVASVLHTCTHTHTHTHSPYTHAHTHTHTHTHHTRMHTHTHTHTCTAHLIMGNTGRTWPRATAMMYLQRGHHTVQPHPQWAPPLKGPLHCS